MELVDDLHPYLFRSSPPSCILCLNTVLVQNHNYFPFRTVHWQLLCGRQNIFGSHGFSGISETGYFRDKNAEVRLTSGIISGILAPV